MTPKAELPHLLSIGSSVIGVQRDCVGAKFPVRRDRVQSHGGDVTLGFMEIRPEDLRIDIIR